MILKAKLDMPQISEMIKGFGLNEGGRVQKFIDNFVLYKSLDYIPGKHIHDSGVIATRIGSGKVIWDSPDANYLYEGKLMVDPKTLKGAFFSPDFGFWSRPNTQKIIDPNGRNLEYTKGGSHWFDRLMDDKEDEFYDGISRIIKGEDI